MSRDVRVKMCGLVRATDVREAVRLGADYLGFIFAPGGPRTLTPEQGAALLGELDTGRSARVGVFRDQPAQWINAVVARCGLQLVQLHGHEPRDFPAAIRVPVLRTRRVPGRVANALALSAAGADVDPKPGDERVERAGAAVALAPNVFAAHLDSETAAGESGGLGLAPDPRALARALGALPAGTRVFLAGGLTPENVAACVARFRPWAVDVASGIESAPGVKDPRRMAAFMAALETTR